jgi:hypothetical protein
VRIVTVLQTRALNALQRGSSEYTIKHVQALQAQIAKWAPLATLECISDVNVPGVKCIHPNEQWPGWWMKMNLFSPDVPGDFLFMDLDTVIVGPLDDILAVNKLTLLRDFYRDGKKLKEGLGGGLIYLPADARKDVWGFWRQQPQLQMRVYSRGDQFLMEKFYLESAARWQDVVPGQVVSWKVHCKGDIVPPEARVVCFHGHPRPWSVGPFLHLYR